MHIESNNDEGGGGEIKLKYNKETYNSSPLIEKIIIKNQINKIINAYKLFALKKSVVSNPNIIFIYF